VPLITNIQVAQMFAESLEAAGARATGNEPNNKVVLDVRSLHEWIVKDEEVESPTPVAAI